MIKMVRAIGYVENADGTLSICDIIEWDVGKNTMSPRKAKTMLRYSGAICMMLLRGKIIGGLFHPIQRPKYSVFI